MPPAISQPLSRAERAHENEANAPADAHTTAVRDSWQALWSSRLLVWVVGVAAVALLSVRSASEAYDPQGLTSKLGSVGEALAGPAARWDAALYLVIAKSGYQPGLGAQTLPRDAFFPGYPLLIRAVNLVGIPLIVAGIIVSMCAFAAALYGIHRLTSLEFAHTEHLEHGRPERIARLSVFVTAFGPMAVFFSAIYAESLFLALSVAMFWCARRGRWALVGITGGLAVATRSTGLVLALPALVIYLYGPRDDRDPDRQPTGAGESVTYARRVIAALTPRYRIRPDVLWLALLPAAVVAFAGSIALSGGGILNTFKAEHEVWGRTLVGPIAGLVDVVHHPHVTTLVFLLAAIPAVIGVLRRLPPAYGLYALAAIVVAISDPKTNGEDPLTSLPRFMLVLFPLSMWFAAWLTEHPRLRWPALILSALAMSVFVARFATWRWAS